jgi:hypothetical protein
MPLEDTLVNRYFGLLPLGFFLGRLAYFHVQGGASQILWLCHLGNLVLAVGLLFNQPFLIRVAVLWLILGFPLWLGDVAQFGLEGLTSAVTHLGGLVVGLAALRQIGFGQTTWHYALAWYLLMQLVCRWWTAPEMNINIAHSVYRGWEGIFPRYPLYWVLITIGAAASLWFLERLLIHFFPPNPV